MWHVALLGSGFSRNWGGWLANEAFEYLIGTPEVLADPGLLELLWRYRENGGFEDALAELQAWLRPPPPALGVEYNMGSNVPLLSQATALQKAIMGMFDSMNESYNRQFEFEDPIRSLLGKFDAIFTLNQDMLLERLYAPQFSRMDGIGDQRWTGAVLPGMRRTRKVRRTGDLVFWSDYAWEPLPSSELRDVEQGLQPIYKLHGSSQWYVPDATTPILIIGGEKSRAIRQFEVLDWYARCFDSWLARGTRLMVIGYGFRDPHINKALLQGDSAGLQLFIVDPNGPEAALNAKLQDIDGPQAAAARAELKGFDAAKAVVARAEWVKFVKRRLIGASRRGIRHPMGRPDHAEYAKVMRFFDL